MTHEAHEKMHHEIAEAQQKGIKHENHENFHTVAGIYNTVGRYSTCVGSVPIMD